MKAKERYKQIKSKRPHAYNYYDMVAIIGVINFVNPTLL